VTHFSSACFPSLPSLHPTAFLILFHPLPLRLSRNMPPSRGSANTQQMNCFYHVYLPLLLSLLLLRISNSSPSPPVVPFPMPTYLSRGNTTLRLSPWTFQFLDLSDTPMRTLRLAMERCEVRSGCGGGKGRRGGRLKEEGSGRKGLAKTLTHPPPLTQINTHMYI